MNEKDLLISVIVPIYNIEEYLTRCIESLINQTYKNLEIILVNDGSTDNAKEICNKYALNDARIKVIHKENGGLVSARQAGLAVSTGDYIGYVDGDDWVEPEMYEDLVFYARKFDVDIVIAGHKEELAGNIVEVLFNSIQCGLYINDDLEKLIYPYMLYMGKFSQFGIFSYLWNKLFRREVLYDNQMAVDKRIFMAEDAACTYPTLLTANSIYISESSHYHYVQRVDSMVKSRTLNSDELNRYNVLYDFLYSKFSLSKYVDILVPQLNYFLLSLLTVRSNLSFNSSNNLNELFAFGDIPLGSKIVIYGAGTFGQHLVKRIQLSKNFNLVGWVDNFYRSYNILGLNISPIKDINEINYDYIVVAYINEIYSDNIEKSLIDYGVNATKILKVSHYIDYPIEKLLEGYGINPK